MDVRTAHFIWLMAITFALSAGAQKLGIVFAARIGLFAQPSARRRHERPTPTSGGLWVLTSLLSGLAVYCWIQPQWLTDNWPTLWRLSVAVSALTILGYFDDRKILRVRDKFIVQLLVSLFSLSLPGIQEFTAAFYPTFGMMIYPLVVVFMVGITNAINFIDGADGLLGSALMIFFGALFARGVLFHPQSYVLVLVTGLIGAIAGFLLFNWRPAKIFMGDTGSLPLGFLLVTACLSLPPGPAWQGSLDEAAGGVMQLGFPILDLLWVIAKRTRNGFSPFRADQNHLHHCMMRSGFSVRHCVLALASLNLCFQLTALDVAQNSLAGRWPMVLVMGCFALLFLTWIVVVGRWRTRELGKLVNAKSQTHLHAVASSSRPAEEFSLVIHMQPLFDGHDADSSEQTLSAIQTLGFMLESNCPRGTEVLWQPRRKVICLVFPESSVNPQDVTGLQLRIQLLINNWIEMFNISLSATSLRVQIATAQDRTEKPQKLKLVPNQSLIESGEEAPKNSVA